MSRWSTRRCFLIALAVSGWLLAQPPALAVHHVPTYGARDGDPEVSSYAYKFGRPADSRCDDGAGYRVALVPFLSLPKNGRPYTFCAIPYDAAMNPGLVVEELLP